jgi:hypothetical protein
VRHEGIVSSDRDPIVSKAIFIGAAIGAVFLLLVVAAGYRVLNPEVQTDAAQPPAEPTSESPAPARTRAVAAETHPAAAKEKGFIYGWVNTVTGATYEGRLRFGGSQEAFWSDYFNGVKHESPWLAQVPQEQVPRVRSSIGIFGWKIGSSEHQLEVTRQLVTPFGEIARIEPRRDTVRVTLKNGTDVEVNRFDASDFDDGVRVWDGAKGDVHIDSMRVRMIELLPTPALGDVPSRLHGTVRTGDGEFSGFIAWDREKGVGTDELVGRSEGKGDGEDVSLRFDTIRSIAHRAKGGALVTLLDGSEIVLSRFLNRGILVDDRRYGRVAISWDAFERLDFTPSDSGPAYGDFPPGRRLTGSVTKRAGGRLAGQLVFDLDESETTETLDGSLKGVDYNMPFGLIASIAPATASVTLHNGEKLKLELDGDLGEQNAGMLVFVEGRERPEYVPWADIERVDFDRPEAMYPPL